MNFNTIGSTVIILLFLNVYVYTSNIPTTPAGAEVVATL